MDQATHNKIVSFIWGIADDVLRDLFKRGKYPDVILPMCVLRRMDAVLEPTKKAVLETKEMLDKAGITEQRAALAAAAGQSFYNTSKFTLRDLKSRGSQQQLLADFEDYLNGFSQNVQDIVENFKFRNQLSTLSKSDSLGTLIGKFLDPEINLSPDPVLNADRTVKHPGMDNHSIGTVFEELVRKFNEENNKEAGEHWTPRDAIRLVANIVFLPIADQIKSGSYLLYDGAIGTGGMLTVAEETLVKLARVRGNQITTHLYGQEINPETYASYRVEKKAAMKIALADADAEIGPVPVEGGGQKREPELDRLSNILRAFNEQFGTLFTDTDRVARRIKDDIAPKVAADPDYQNAKRNTPNAARIEHDKALAKVMLTLLKDDTQVYKQFVENESFRRFVTDMVFTLTSE